MVTCSLLSAVGLDQVHRPHAAHVVGVAYKLPTWGVQADFAAVASHPAALGFTRTRSLPFLPRTIVVVNAVVVLAQHGQIRGFRVSTMFVCVDVVDLASIGRYGAVRPRAHQVFRHG